MTASTPGAVVWKYWTLGSGERAEPPSQMRLRAPPAISTMPVKPGLEPPKFRSSLPILMSEPEPTSWPSKERVAAKASVPAAVGAT